MFSPLYQDANGKNPFASSGKLEKAQNTSCAFQNTYPETFSSIKTKLREAKSSERTLRDIIFVADFSVQKRRAIWIFGLWDRRDKTVSPEGCATTGHKSVLVIMALQPLCLEQPPPPHTALLCHSQLNYLFNPNAFPPPRCLYDVCSPYFYCNHQIHRGLHIPEGKGIVLLPVCKLTPRDPPQGSVQPSVCEWDQAVPMARRRNTAPCLSLPAGLQVLGALITAKLSVGMDNAL